MIYEREVVRLNWWGKAVVIALAPLALSGAFLSTFALEIGTALMRAWWELRFEWNKVKMFLR